MLRDGLASNFSSVMSLQNHTTPPPSPPAPSNNHFDDIFGGSDDEADNQHNEGHPSDITRLRQSHTTAGYRDGISASKAQHVQEGFDEGFALGAEIGQRVGWILGVLEGIVVGLKAALAKLQKEGGRAEQEKCEVLFSRFQEGRDMFRRAKEELAIQKVFGKEWFGEEGVWTYDVPVLDREGTGPVVADGGEDIMTFRDVAHAHPLVNRWKGLVEGLVETCGVDLAVLDRRSRDENEEDAQEEIG
ncbi:hypothetical protein LTS18_009932 [Coniosporium uncinatum]|uniref:Uncharacterized protein n=1 Tax=Coniosporium uncinatum TaxID=93489 RepID=A0ACC3DLG5_9PEZI|nr:hypothetical protein LTS18_009932 [Coniosporium uncinatum]